MHAGWAGSSLIRYAAPGPLAVLVVTLLSSCGSGVSCGGVAGAGGWSGVAVNYQDAVTGLRSQHLVARLCVRNVCVTRGVTRRDNRITGGAGVVRSTAAVPVTLLIKSEDGRIVFDARVSASPQAPSACQTGWELGLATVGHHRLKMVHVGST